MATRRYAPPPRPVVDWVEEQRIAEMLEDGPEPEPQPEPDDNAWMQAEVEAARARIAERALMDRAARPRPEPAARIDLGIGLTGARRIGTWDPVMRRYNIRDEQVPMHRLDRDPFDNF